MPKIHKTWRKTQEAQDDLMVKKYKFKKGCFKRKVDKQFVDIFSLLYDSYSNMEGLFNNVGMSSHKQLLCKVYLDVSYV